MPPQMRNDRQLLRLPQPPLALARRARRGARRDDRPRDERRQAARQRGRVVGVRTGDRGRGTRRRGAGELRAGQDIRRPGDHSRGGHARSPDAGRDRAVRPRRPAAGLRARGEGGVGGSRSRSCRSSTRSAGRCGGGGAHREFGGSFIYPMGDNLVSLGLVVGLDYTDPALSVHDLLQQLKTPSARPEDPRGREAHRLGRQDDSRRGLPGPPPSRLHFPGGLLVGDAAGLVNVPALKGIHYAMRIRAARSRDCARGRRPGATAWSPGRSSHTTKQSARASSGRTCGASATCGPRPAKGSCVGSALAGLATASLRQVPPRRPAVRGGCRAPELRRRGSAATRSRTGRSRSTSSRASSRPGTKPETTRRPHPGAAARPAALAEAWVHMCPAQVYAIDRRGREDDT